MPSRPYVLAGAAYLALSFLFFWPLFTPKAVDRGMLGPPDGDFMRQFYPYRVLVARQLAAGEAPLWNPHQSAGAPAWADPQYAVLYPWRLAQAPFALSGRTLPLWAVELEVVAHLALAGLGVFALLTGLGAAGGAAFLAGGLFAFGGFLTGYPVEQLAVLDTSAWLPWMLVALTAAVRRSIDGRRQCARRAAIAAGGATTLALFAGHPQSVLYGLYFGLAWTVWFAVHLRRSRTLLLPDSATPPREAVRASLRDTIPLIGIWLGTAAGLSAAQWWPSYAFWQVAARQLAEQDLLAGLALGDVAQLVAPGVVTQYSPLYVGVIGLTLAIIAVRQDAVARFWAALAGVAWLIALGGHGPLLPLLLRLAPGFALFRHHERAAGVASLALAIAAGLGLDLLLRSRATPSAALKTATRFTTATAALMALAGLVATARPSAVERVVRWLGGGSGDATALAEAGGQLADTLVFGALVLALWVIALALYRAGRIPPRRLAGGAIALGLLELFTFDRAPVLRRHVPVFHADAVVQYLNEHAGTLRISSEGLLPGGPNAATVYGLVDVNGDSPLEYANLTRMFSATQEVEWLKVLGVHHVVTRREIAAGYPLTEVFRDGDRRVYDVDRAALPAGLADGPDWWYETYGIIAATYRGIVTSAATLLLCLWLWHRWRRPEDSAIGSPAGPV